ncbi:hypothetical protein BEN49_06680 [Hymenobacter coccineus]|uniref:Uncharacterized protein n=1 Tax=Hymenobacter coccineus TaxID=1908235 RepID=A0A1G1THU5_9BACT|nr:hypothetical protein BEN49_06680 [Hymenobacter coccineus]
MGAGQAAQAQGSNMIHLISLGTRLGVRALAKDKQPVPVQPIDQATADKNAAANTAATIAAQPKELVLHRTPADQLPKKGADQITALEAQLEQCHAAMLATPGGIICTPEQRTAIQSAAVSVARARSNWDLQPYQQELAYYQAEDARRQQAAAAPAN